MTLMAPTHGPSRTREAAPGFARTPEETLFPERVWPALRAGETAAREMFYQTYAESLHRAIRAWAHQLSPEESEDLLSESFVRAFRGIQKVRSWEHLEGWLFALARNTVMDFCRARNRATKVLLLEDLSPAGREEALASAGSPACGDALHELALKEDRGRLAALVGQVLAELPARQQEALIMMYQQNQGLEAIGARWEITPEAVASLLYRAREAFRERFEKRRTVLERESGHGRKTPSEK